MAFIFTKPITEIIRQRTSCRSFSARPIEPGKRLRLTDCAREMEEQASEYQARFELVAANTADLREINQLSTYGFIHGASGFLIGAIQDGDSFLEKFGYLMEKWVLIATDLGFGTCWLGGTFSRSNFARRINAGEGEIIPAAIAIGYPAAKIRIIEKSSANKQSQSGVWLGNNSFFTRILVHRSRLRKSAILQPHLTWSG